MSEIVIAPIEDVLIDQNILPNIRGDVTNTADLQAAMRQGNYLEQFPVKVIPHPTEGKYLCWDGARRLTAARIIGLKEVPLLVSDITPEEALRRQLAVMLHKDQPVIVLGRDGEVVAGICWAVHQLTDGRSGQSNIAVANLLGEKPDTISAYRQLFSESVQVKQRVANGDIAITVYSRLKHQSEEIKNAILQKKGVISRSYVDGWLKSHKDGVLRDVEETGTAVTGSDDRQFVEYREFTENSGGVNVTAVLQKVKNLLRQVAGEDLQETDYIVLDEIDNLLGEFK